MANLNTSVDDGKFSKCLPNYQILKVIGKGNFAKVRIAIHKITGKKVAIKFISKEKMGPQNSSKALREVYGIKKMNHPNIVQLFEYCDTPDELILVTEFVSGGELYEHLLNKGKMKETQARANFRQIASAVQHMHSKMIVHRDLKAENMMFDENKNIKIVDFGFSNKFDWQGRLNTYCGSPPYAAPELFLGKSYIGPEVDVWSLGIVLYAMLTGSLPFHAKELFELKRLILECKIRIPFYMSTEAESLLKRLLVVNPTRRAKIEDIINDPWVNKGYIDCPLSSFTFPPRVCNNYDIIQKIFQLGLNTIDEIQQTFLHKKYNHIMALYLLLEEPTRQNEGNTVNEPLILKSQRSFYDKDVSTDTDNANSIHKMERVSSPKLSSTKNPNCFIGMLTRLSRLFRGASSPRSSSLFDNNNTTVSPHDGDTFFNEHRPSSNVDDNAAVTVSKPLLSPCCWPTTRATTSDRFTNEQQRRCLSFIMDHRPNTFREPCSSSFPNKETSKGQNAVISSSIPKTPGKKLNARRNIASSGKNQSTHSGDTNRRASYIRPSQEQRHHSPPSPNTFKHRHSAANWQYLNIKQVEGGVPVLPDDSSLVKKPCIRNCGSFDIHPTVGPIISEKKRCTRSCTTTDYSSKSNKKLKPLNSKASTCEEETRGRSLMGGDANCISYYPKPSWSLAAAFTTQLSPQELVEKTLVVLPSLNLAFIQESAYIIRCNYYYVKTSDVSKPLKVSFSIRIRRMAFRRNCCGVQFRHILGSIRVYDGLVREIQKLVVL